MLRTFMQAVSVVIHPIIIPCYLVLLPLWCMPAVAYGLHLYLVLFVMLSYTMLPALLLWFLYSLGVISSLRMTRLVDRRIGLAAVSTWYAIISYLLHTQLPIHTILMAVLWGITLMLALLLIGNIKMKVSLHTAGCGSVVGYLIAAHQLIPSSELIWSTAIAVVVMGLMMSSRIYLKAHRSIETYVGAIIGIASTYGMEMWLAA